ncbi:hypothetical protein SGRIM128S_05106 [Streptomyces griseomycini]
MAGLAAGAVLVLAGGLALKGATESSGGSTDTADASSSAPGPGSPRAGGTEEKPKDGSTASPAKEKKETESRRGEGGAAGETEEDGKGTEEKPDPDSAPVVLERGPSPPRAAAVTGSAGASGHSTYVVQVEDGIGIPAPDVAAEVERILADGRGWTADGKVGFRRVSGASWTSGQWLATAGTVDDICGQYGLDTGGEVNCNVGQDVMVNLKRWLLATQYYADARYLVPRVDHQPRGGALPRPRP